MKDKEKQNLNEIMIATNLDREDLEDSGINIFKSDDLEEKKEITKLKPEWKNEPTFDDLNNDFIEAMNYHEEFKEKLLLRKKNFEGGPEINAPKGKSNYRPKLIRKNAEWKYPALEDPFLSSTDLFKINPRTWEDEKAAEQNEIILNYQWHTKINRVKFINDIVRGDVDEGTVIVKVLWNAEWGTKLVEEEKEIFMTTEESFMHIMNMVQNGEMTQEEADLKLSNGELISKGTEKVYVDKETLIKNEPEFEVCNPANVIIDPTCDGDISKATFIAHEYNTSLAELKKDEYVKTVEEYEEVDPISGSTVKVQKITETGFYKNLDSIDIDAVEFVSDEYGSEAANTFKHKDKTRRKIRAYEYWGYWDVNGDGTLKSIVATWVGKTLIRLEENPFPHKKLPFAITTYMPVKREIHGETDGDLLIENQESIGKMTRAAHDITAQQAIGQEFIDEQLFSTPVQKSNYENGKTVYVRHGVQLKESIYRRSVDPIPNSVFQMIDMQNSDAESLTGTKSFSGGIGSQALGNVAAGIRSAMDATSKRELSILRRLNQLLNDIARLTIANNQAFLQEEEVIRITNGWVTIRRDDLAGEFDLIVDVSTPEQDNDKAEKLFKLMQTNAASMDPKIAAKHYMKLANLWKMPDLANDVKEIMDAPAPAPDPRVEETINNQLEESRMKLMLIRKQMEEIDSRIHERISRSLENDIDIREKNSQATLNEEKAREIRARADILDKQFLDDVNGKKREDKLEDELIKENARISTINHKAMVDIEKKRIEESSYAGSNGEQSSNQYVEPEM